MYNRNYGGFDCVRIHSELLTSVLNRKLLTLIPQLTVIRDRCPQYEKTARNNDNSDFELVFYVQRKRN